MSTRPRRQRAVLISAAVVAVLALLGSGLPAQADDDVPETPAATSDPSPSAPSADPTETASPTPEETESADPEDDGESTDAGPTDAAAADSPLQIWRQMRTWDDFNRSHVYDAGDDFHYRYAIRNAGTYTVRGLSAQLTRGAPCRMPVTTLAPGQQTTCDAYVLLDRIGSYYNVAAVRADNAAARASSRDLVVAPCAYNAPGTSAPGDGTYFNHPFGSRYDSNNIRYMVLRAINSTPKCESIKIAAFAVNDNTTVSALISAYRRGVQVQVIGDAHLIRGDRATQSPSFKRLMATLGASTRNRSWARVCSYSCRGTGGNHHYKLYLFSAVGASRKPSMTMVGSANLTTKAQGGQWNHIDVRSNLATWTKYSALFRELIYDRPVTPSPWRVYNDITPQTWVFPRPGSTAANDPMMGQLGAISCKGSAFNGGRTVVRIGMYAWFGTRGEWLARQVRALWNAGCDVAIQYAVIGNTTKQILYSPSGRGRIPMRQVATYYSDGTINAYDHHKYVTIAGKWNGNPSSYRTWTGTTNFTNLGFSSDDMTTVWNDYYHWNAYRTDFSRVWGGSNSRVPSPTSRLPGALNTGTMTFGQGRYAALEQN